MAMGDNLLENKNVSLSIIVLVFASLVYVLFLRTQSLKNTYIRCLQFGGFCSSLF